MRPVTNMNEGKLEMGTMTKLSAVLIASLMLTSIGFFVYRAVTVERGRPGLETGLTKSERMAIFNRSGE